MSLPRFAEEKLAFAELVVIACCLSSGTVNLSPVGPAGKQGTGSVH